MSESTEKPTFECALAELETLVSRMENGKLPLAELIAGFERGNKLAAFCRGELGKLERRIEVLTSDDGGEGRWAAFESAVPPGGRQGGAAENGSPVSQPGPDDSELPF